MKKTLFYLLMAVALAIIPALAACNSREAANQQPKTTNIQPPAATTTASDSGDALVVSIENHPGQTDDSLCNICHPEPYTYPADHEGRASGCLASGCHTLSSTTIATGVPRVTWVPG